MTLMCDFGGDYIEKPDGRYALQPLCTELATVRYRTHGFVEGHWSGRCDRHRWMLDAPGMAIEPVGARKEEC